MRRAVRMRIEAVSPWTGLMPVASRLVRNLVERDESSSQRGHGGEGG